MKKIIAVLISILMLIPSSWVFAKDYSGHWAEEAINLLISEDIISGNSNGSINPEGYITRAEFVKITNRVFEYTEESEEQFPDVSYDRWYEKDFRIAKKEGYIKGDNNGRANPEKSITRAEVCVAWSRALKLNTSNKEYTGFKDDSDIPEWAKGSVNAMKSLGVISGYTDNTFKSSNQMKRGEIFSVSSKLLKDPTFMQPVSVGITTSPETTKAPVSSGGGGGGGGGSAPSSSGLSAPSNLRWLDSEYKVCWNQVADATSYVVTVEITTPETQLVWTKQPVSVTSTEYNLKGDIEELMSADISELRKTEETFKVSVVAKNSSATSSPAVLNGIEWKNIYIPFPEISFEQKTNTDESEEIAFVWMPDDNALSYKLEIDFEGEGNYTEIPSTNGKASLSTEQINKIKGKHNVRISAPSKDSTKYLSLKEQVTEIELPLFAGEKDGKNLIANKRHFENMAVNEEKDTEYLLVQDITLSNHSSFEFGGVFDGDNKTINLDNLTASIFSVNKGTVKNVKFEGNAILTEYECGIIAGNNQGTIANCENRAAAEIGNSRGGGMVGYNQGGTLNGLRNYAEITLTKGTTGGICGYSTGKISNCANYGDITITATSSAHGGIVGNQQTTSAIESCANFGNITASGDAYNIGGIIGEFRSANTTAVKNCVNAGNITVKSGKAAAGIIASLDNESYDDVKIENSYNSGIITIGNADSSNAYAIYNYEAAGVTGTTVVNGYYLISGDTVGKGASVGLTSDEMKLEESFEDFDFTNIWTIDSSNKLYSYPQLIDAPHWAEPVKLATPSYSSSGTPRNNGENVELTLKVSEGTLKLKAGIYSGTDLVGEEKEIICEEGKTEYKILFPLTGLTVGNIYTIKAKATGDGVYYLTSEEFADDNYEHKNIVLPAPVLNDVFWCNDDTETQEEDEIYKISWSPVASVGNVTVAGYKVEVSDGSDTENEIITSTTYKIHADDATFANKTVTVKITAVDSLNEEISTSSETDAINLKYALPVMKDNVAYQGIGNKRHFDNMEATGNYIITNNFEMTGYTSKANFSGVLDGDGKTVTLTNGTMPLFSAMASSGKIRNLTTAGDVSLTGAKNAIYVAINSGTIENCKNYATLIGGGTHNAVFAGQNGGTLKYCFNYAELTLKKQYSGSIAGYNTGTVKYCGNEGTIDGESYEIGGIIGQHQGSNFEYCYNTGNVTGLYDIGGIIGKVNSANISISNCFNEGDITATTSGKAVAGTVANINKTGVSILNCYNTGNIKVGNTEVSVSAAFYHTVLDTCTLTNCYYLDKANAGTAKEGSSDMGESEINSAIQSLKNTITSGNN